ncbi:unnamed protein product [Pelagomonas calceolata]|uniref:Peptidase M14 domain-containing protein n=1 Tax=Pelagomonas calceolata TaxID=35677 RepID=A0A8J2SX14_9STRA|nr:unnamed protein product [Pelagomonas calceolata]|mmetsp:Transcript_10877/g.32326  ORF Transcript_10877/g.32326 Transcript_10877/m.32326 type:complete len:694 (-) Transcript_10877:1216-3297(-)
MPGEDRPLYRCSKAGATVREGVELSSTKVGRLAGKSIVGISEERTTEDGVARARLDSRADDLEGGWVSKWVLKPMDEDSQPPPPPPMEDPAGPWLELEDGVLEIDGLRFTSDFCSGNLQCVRKGHDGVLELAARRDNQGTPFESRHCAWLYFRVEDKRRKKESVTLRVRSASRQAALYRAGYRPVERDGSCRRSDGSDWASLSGDAGWKRIAQHSFRWNECPDVVPPDTPSKRKSRYAQKRSDLDTPKALLEWDAEFPPSGVLEFAFCYPYSYESVCATVDALARANLGDDVYLRRETLTTSLEGRPVELLTITANDDTYFGDEPLDWRTHHDTSEKSSRGGLAFNISSEGGDDSSDDGEDSGPEGTNKPSLPKPPLLTPHRKDTEVRACSKREVVISARVHPGETPAQFVIDGLLAAVLADGPVGQALREAYVWRVVPCLNPDGVARGHYRKDARGDDQNRQYWPPPSPKPSQHPAQAALQALARSSGDRLRCLVDVHAHANKRGCFLFGNHNPLGGPDAPELLACRLSAHSRHAEWQACDFSRRKMGNSGSCRVALHHAGIADGRPRGAEPPAHAYTLECNYNKGTTATTSVVTDDPPGSVRAAWAKCSYLSPLLAAPYDPGAWRDVGRALAMALLDLAADDAARGLDDVRTTRTLDECRNWLEAQRLKERRIKAKFRPRRKKKEPLSSNS